MAGIWRYQCLNTGKGYGRLRLCLLTRNGAVVGKGSNPACGSALNKGVDSPVPHQGGNGLLTTVRG